MKKLNKIADILKRRIKFSFLNIIPRIKLFFGYKNLTFHEDPQRGFE